MKILQIAPFYYPHIGGVENHVAGLTKALRKKHVEVEILTSRYDNRLPEKEVIDDVVVHRAGPSFTLFNTPITFNIEKKIKMLDFDIAHMHYPPPVTSYLAAVGCHKNSKKYCLTYHCDLELDVPFGSSIVKLYQEFFAYYTVKYASKIIVHTQSYQESSSILWNTDSIIIPSAVDIEHFNSAIDGSALLNRYRISGKNIILFVGRLVPHKGIDQMIYALKRLKSDTVLIIVGTGPLLQYLKKLAKDLSIESRVIFADNVSDKELPYYYSIADVFVLPSLTRLEAFGMVTIEAMASGKPVIVSDIPGVRDIVTDGEDGLLFQPFIMEDLVGKLTDILDDDNKRKEMGRKGRKKVEEYFTWDKVADEIIALYKKIVES